jgi:glycerol-3-phosphate acyltransferase PlsY
MTHQHFAQFAAVDATAWLWTALAVVGAYLVGSIPFGVLVARAKGVDIRQVGSGNIGATNVGRTLGRFWGFLVFGLDFLKGFGPTLAARLLGPRIADDPFFVNDLYVLAALAAVLGHVFSVWLGFRGGKAGATGLGVGAVVCWQAMIAAGTIWLVVVGVTRYVSIGTMLGSIAYVAAYLIVVLFWESACPLDRAHITRTVFCVAITALVIFRHKDNIQRLLAGTESKV